jgi:pyruvate dehydrogenase (quinone)
MSTLADQFADTLPAASVKGIYGVRGDSVSGLTDSLPHQVKIGRVHVGRDAVAAFSAGAEAHFTSALAVCASGCGPGNLHFIYDRFECLRSREPVLAITANIPSTEIGCGYFQETRPQAPFKERSRYCELVSGSNQMPRACWGSRSARRSESPGFSPGGAGRSRPVGGRRRATSQSYRPAVAARDELDGLATLLAMTG